MKIDIVTIFPEYFAPLEISLLGKARRAGLLDVHVHDLRAWTHDRHRTVDDTPYGGGPGMVMKPDPWGEALDTLIPPHPANNAPPPPIPPNSPPPPTGPAPSANPDSPVPPVEPPSAAAGTPTKAIPPPNGLAPTDVTDWQFVEIRDVPPDPWRSYGENNHFVIARRQMGAERATEQLKKLSR